MEATPKSRNRGRRERRLPRAVTSATIELSDPNRPLQTATNSQRAERTNHFLLRVRQHPAFSASATIGSSFQQIAPGAGCHRPGGVAST
jgi:hypothetical protein